MWFSYIIKMKIFNEKLWILTAQVRSHEAMVSYRHGRQVELAIYNQQKKILSRLDVCFMTAGGHVALLANPTMTAGGHVAFNVLK